MTAAGRLLASGRSGAAALVALALAAAFALPSAAAACCRPDERAPLAAAMGCCTDGSTLRCAACPAPGDAAAARTAWTGPRLEGANALPPPTPAVAVRAIASAPPNPAGGFEPPSKGPPLYRLHAQLLI